MKTKMLVTVVLAFGLALITSVGFTGGPAPEKGSAQLEKGPPVVVTGKIAFMKQLDGYIVNGKDPAGEFIIVNQNPQVLEKLLKSAKMVKIDGYLRGAEFLTIEKIDGKPYSAK
jgi:hypothetical protein